MKFAPEGYPFIISATAMAVIAFIVGWSFAGIFFAAVALFMLYFFRDPDRIVPGDADIFVAPADGKIIVVREVHEQEHLHEDMMQVSIFMSPLNVHVNRVPCDCTVKKVSHVKGRFLAAYRDEASIQNEHIDMVIGTEHGDLLVRQVAGFVARRAVCRKKEGDMLKRGERYGLIKFSSRVDIYMPKDTAVKVGMGDMVRAGETVIGRISSKA